MSGTFDRQRLQGFLAEFCQPTRFQNSPLPNSYGRHCFHFFTEDYDNINTHYAICYKSRGQPYRLRSIVLSATIELFYFINQSFDAQSLVYTTLIKI